MLPETNALQPGAQGCTLQAAISDFNHPYSEGEGKELKETWCKKQTDLKGETKRISQEALKTGVKLAEKSQKTGRNISSLIYTSRNCWIKEKDPRYFLKYRGYTTQPQILILSM